VKVNAINFLIIILFQLYCIFALIFHFLFFEFLTDSQFELI